MGSESPSARSSAAPWSAGSAWHWIFWVNVPIGLALIPFAATKIGESFGPRPRLDVPGLTLAAAASLAVTWGLVRAGAVGWTSAEVIGSILAGLALGASFLAWERRAREPMLPLELFAQRTFALSNAVSFFLYAGLFGALFLMAQFFQTCLGYSPLGAGLRLLAWSMPPMFIAPLAGSLADRYGNRPFMALGLALQAAGLAWVALVASPTVSYPVVAVALLIAGTGTSFCFPTVANSIMGAVPIEEAGVAAGTNSTLRELGGVFGVSLLAGVFAGHAVFTSKSAFVAGFTDALWVAVGFSVLGACAALAIGGRAATAPTATPAPAEAPS